jgi:hypothetical protein
MTEVIIRVTTLTDQFKLVSCIKKTKKILGMVLDLLLA